MVWTAFPFQFHHHFQNDFINYMISNLDRSISPFLQESYKTAKDVFWILNMIMEPDHKFRLNKVSTAVKPLHALYNINLEKVSHIQRQSPGSIPLVSKHKYSWDINDVMLMRMMMSWCDVSRCAELLITAGLGSCLNALSQMCAYHYSIILCAKHS